jgi:hypothetical protein
MRIKELFQNVDKRKASAVGVNRFRLTLDKENVKTPHYCMQKVEDILQTRTSLANGLRQLMLFTMPDLHFTSDDEKSSVFANEWLEQRDDMQREISNFLYLFLGGGNSYFEPLYIKMKNGKKCLDNLYNVPLPSTVYVNLNAKSEEEYWVVEYPLEVFSARGKVLRFVPVSYVYGSYMWRNNVWGITLAKDELEQLKFMWSPSPFYGTGLLTTSIDNEDVAEEILKNWALSAKYRSLSKKIIGFYNEDGESVDPSELDRIQDQFDSMEEEDSLLVNKKFVSSDLTFTGADNMMNQELEFLRKDSGASLTPNYMTAFSQDSSLATASEAKVPFALSIEATQRIFQKFLNNLITKNLKECYSFLKDDLELVLGKAELYSRNENFMNYSQLYNMRACSFNELRISAGAQAVEGGDTWGEKPPLDKTTTQIKLEERFKRKVLREQYKRIVEKVPKPKKFFQEQFVLKNKELSQDKSFASALKDVLR